MKARDVSVRADATSEDLNKKLKEVTETLSEKWEETDDKPAVITLGVYALIGRVPPGVGGGGMGAWGRLVLSHFAHSRRCRPFTLSRSVKVTFDSLPFQAAFSSLTPSADPFHTNRRNRNTLF